MGVPASDRIRAKAVFGGELCERCAPVLTSNRKLRVLAIGALVVVLASAATAAYLGGPLVAVTMAALPALIFVVALLLMASWHRRVSRDILGERLVEKLIAGLPEAGGAISPRRIRVHWGSARNPIRIAELGRTGR